MRAQDKVSIQFLHECFDCRDGVLYWKERPAHHFKRPADHATFIKKSAGKPAGRHDPKGYLDVKFRNGGLCVCLAAHRIVWAMHYGKWPELPLDHINRVRDDNRIENLREVTPAQNADNSSWRRVHPYVTADGDTGRFVAWTNIGGQKTIYLGIFDTEAEAVAQRDTVNAELEKVARNLTKKTPRPTTYRPRRHRTHHQTFSQQTPMGGGETD